MRQLKKIIIILLTGTIGIAVLMCGIGYMLAAKTPRATPPLESADHPKEKEIPSKSIEPVKDITLASGNYIAGKDFKEGKYDIVAISGNGNVISDNVFNGGINAMMGIDTQNYEKEYKNISLPKGVKLQVLNVKIKLVYKGVV